ncbi:MRG-domain-containing protein [Mycena floridula]|nr:MRG-domain-containing protein [Mycena floridula]
MADVLPTFEENERCLCYHGPLIFEAKVIQVEDFEAGTTPTGVVGRHYRVHYKNWKDCWDDWLTPNQVLKLNEKNKAMQESLLAEARAQANRVIVTKPQGKDHAGSSKSGAEMAGNKRAREDSDSGMNLLVPEALKNQLLDDWEAVTTNNLVVTLPRTPTTLEILTEFEEYIKSTKPPHLREPEKLIHTVVQGLRAYFEKSLDPINHTLLYRNERPQYEQMRREYFLNHKVEIGKEPSMSMMYGAEHLLRMLVTMPQLVEKSEIDLESRGLISDYTNELMVYMEEHSDRIFQKEYNPSTAPLYVTINQSDRRRRRKEPKEQKRK